VLLALLPEKQEEWWRLGSNEMGVETSLLLWKSSAVADEQVDRASEAYDRVEQEFIAALASGAAEQTLRELVLRVADASRTWEEADHAAAPPPPGISRYYDVPEVVSTLWRELAAAYVTRSTVQAGNGMSALSNAAALCSYLRARQASFTLNIVRDDALLVTVALPGQLWEIEFFDDGTVELDRYVSQGVDQADSLYEQLAEWLEERASPL
jgi:hypothetical protein